MTKYFAKITRKDNTYLVEFPELDGCVTYGETLKEAFKNAYEALNGWLAASCDRDLRIPEPKSRRGKDYYPVVVDFNVEFAINLRKMRKHKRLTQAQVAKILGISQQAYAHLESPEKTNPSLSTMQKISEALNVDIDIKLPTSRK